MPGSLSTPIDPFGEDMEIIQPPRTTPRSHNLFPSLPGWAQSVASRYTAIPGHLFDARSVIDSGLRQQYRAASGDSLDQMAGKIQGLADARGALLPMASNMTPEEAMQLLDKNYIDAMGDTLPVQAMSPQERAYYEAAFNVGDAPGRQFARLSDVPKQMMDFALGYGLVGLLSGEGLAPVSQIGNYFMGRTQEGLDEQYKASLGEFQSKREANLALAKRQAEIDDNNFQQQGYQAKDVREALGSVAREVASLERQTQVEAQKFLNSFSKDIANFIQTGDADRFEPVVALATQISPKLGEALWGIRSLSKTSKEALDDARRDSTVILSERTAQLIKQSESLFPLQKGKLENELRKAGNQADLVAAQMELVKEKVKSWPREVAAQVMLASARAESLRVQAKAALTRALNSGASADDIKILKDASNHSAKAESEAWSQEREYQEQYDAASKALNEANAGLTVAKDKDSQAYLRSQARSAQARVDAIKPKLDEARQRKEKYRIEGDKARDVINRHGGGK